MEFILASIDQVPWRAYSLIQLGTLCLDAATKGLTGGELVNEVTVDPETARWARVALERMLAL